MRLIDAEQVKDFIKNHLPTGIHDDGYTAYQDVIQMLIDEKATPTVEAIPVEWARNWAMKNWVKSKKCEYDIIVSKMIDDWREENGTDRQR